MLELKNVKKKYKDFELDCSMKVEAGKVIGLIGANGAGKSTAFKAALGLIHIDGGEIHILGKNESSPEVKAQIGVVLADSGMSDYLNGMDIVAVFEKMYPTFEKEKFLQKCQHFQIPMDKQLKEFSTGMKRKLHLLLAISHEAKLLILDEPTAGMDVIARTEILDILREYMETEDRAVLISSHISSDLEGFCDEIYMIDRGKIILHEETDVLLDTYGILKVTDEQYENMERTGILKCRKEAYGYCLLTKEKQYYMERYPGIVIEKGSIDEVITMMIRGDE